MQLIKNSAMVLILSAFTSSASAAMVYETWNFEIKDIYGNYLTQNIGDVLSFTIQYDDKSQKMSEYIHGTQGIYRTYCSDEVGADDDCTNNVSNNSFMDDFSILGDSGNDFQNTENLSNDFSLVDQLVGFNFEQLLGDGGAINTSTGLYYMKRYSSHSIADSEIMRFQTSFLEFVASDYHLESREDYVSGIKVSYKNAFGGNDVSGYDLDFVSRNVSETRPAASVNEPASFGVILLGLMGFLVRRFRK